jgi:DNA-binding beta-propeller fold protein YncE
MNATGIGSLLEVLRRVWVAVVKPVVSPLVHMNSHMWIKIRTTMVLIACFCFLPGVATADAPVEFEPVSGFLHLPDRIELGRCSAVSISGKTGELFLFHRDKQPILCFDREGELLRSWGDDVIATAHGLRIDAEDNVWVTDVGNHRVFKFTPQGRLLLSLGTGKPGNDNDQFSMPTDIAFGENGNVYISDGYGNSRVMKFSSKGRLITTWGTLGVGEGEFHLPHSILVDKKHRVLVGDRENDRIQVFDADGKLLDIWNGFAPFGMAFDHEQRLFVADGRANKILQLDATGRVVHSWGGMGKALGQFRMPHMLAFDKTGNLYVAEVDGMRVQKFRRK